MQDKMEELKRMHEQNDLMFSKELYNFYKDNYFNKYVLEQLSLYMNISISYLDSELKKYAHTALKMDEIAYNKYKIEIRSKHNMLILDIENPILKEIGISTYTLWNNEKEKNYFLKYIFNYLLADDFSYERRTILRNQLNMSTYFFDHLINEMLEFNSMSKEEYERRKEKSKQKKIDESYVKLREKNKAKIGIYRKILEIDDFRNVKDAYKEYKYTNSAIKNDFRLYKSAFSKEEIKNIEDKLQKFSDYNVENKDAAHAKETVLETNEKIKKLYAKFLESDKKIDEFYKSEKINASSSKNYFNRLKEVDEELYKKVNDKIEDYKTEKEKNYEENLYILIDQFKTGIIDNGVVRDFDLLDYFLIINYSISETMKRLRKIPNTNKLLTFLHKYISADKENEKDKVIILEEKRIVGAEFDQYGKVIEGTGREITKEEKERIIEYIEKNKIPFNKTTYNVAFRRYINNMLKFDKPKELELTSNE